MTELPESVIRWAEADDWPTLVEFNCRLAAESEGLELQRAVVSAGVRALLADPAKGRYLVASMRGEIVGQLMHTREWSDWRNGHLWWLQSVYVAAAWRGRGIFRQLFQHLATLAENDPQVVGLRLYVEDHNAAARGVYLKLGMRPAGYHVLERLYVVEKSDRLG